jgi:hypothetical protein
MQESKVIGPERPIWNEAAGTNPERLHPQPDHPRTQGEEAMERELEHLLCSSCNRGASSEQTRLRDLIGGLRHLAAQRGLDFWEAFITSRDHETELPLAMFDPRI